VSFTVTAVVIVRRLRHTAGSLVDQSTVTHAR
jgi:hypothetical protein